MRIIIFVWERFGLWVLCDKRASAELAGPDFLVVARGRRTDHTGRRVQSQHHYCWSECRRLISRVGGIAVAGLNDGEKEWKDRGM
jgi:hypothetical protein